MTTFSRVKFHELSEIQSEYCISFYITTQRAGDTKDKSMVRLKNHAQKAEKELATLGLKPREIEEYLKPIYELISDTTFFRNLNKSLAVFRSKDKFEYYTLSFEVEEFSLVSDTFYLLPMLQFFNKKNSFYIFTLSRNKNRLFEATQKEIKEIDTGADFPSSIRDSAGKDTEEREVNIRNVATRGVGTETNFYGKGQNDPDDRELILYLEDINKKLINIIGVDGEPLVIATVESSFGHFKEYSSYKNIYPDFISGNVEEISAQTLHERAKEILQPYFDEARTDKKEILIDGNISQISDLKEIIIAADSGKISTLFVARGKHVWGKYKPEEAIVEIHETKKDMDTCLLDLAARKTFLQGGKVFMVEQENLPNKDTMLNAALRF